METQKLFNPQTDHNIFSTLLDKSDALIMIMDEEGKIGIAQNPIIGEKDRFTVSSSKGVICSIE